VNERMKLLLWRWPLISTIAISVFWGIWYLIAGSVPIITEIHLAQKIMWTLPFGIPRPYIDIIPMPIFAAIAAYLFTLKYGTCKYLFIFIFIYFVFGLVLGMVLCMGIIVVGWPNLAFVLGVIFGLVLGTVFGFVAILNSDLVFGLVFCMVTSLGVGIVLSSVTGIVLGLGIGLIFGLVFCLVACLGYCLGVSAVFSLRFLMENLNSAWKSAKA